jgi:hypothetical protein
LMTEMNPKHSPRVASLTSVEKHASLLFRKRAIKLVAKGTD